MAKLVKLLILLVMALVNLPAYAQQVPTNPWQDFAPAEAPVPSIVNTIMTQALQQAVPSRNNYRYSLPPTATSCVDLSICDLPPIDPPSIYSSGNGNPGNGNNSSNLPPSPGPGYQPIFQHGVFVGYMNPALISMMQTDPMGAWTAFANSSDWAGPEGLRLSLLAETGAATPEQMAQLEQMALFGM